VTALCHVPVTLQQSTAALEQTAAARAEATALQTLDLALDWMFPWGHANRQGNNITMPEVVSFYPLSTAPGMAKTDATPQVQ